MRLRLWIPRLLTNQMAMDELQNTQDPMTEEATATESSEQPASAPAEGENAAEATEEAAS